MSYTYNSLNDSRTNICKVGMDIMDNGLPRSLGPLIFTFVGGGNVSKVAQFIFFVTLHCILNQIFI